MPRGNYSGVSGGYDRQSLDDRVRCLRDIVVPSIWNMAIALRVLHALGSCK